MELLLGILAIVLAIGVITGSNPIRSIIFMGAFSITIATYYYDMGAPDVAMAEATLGAVFTTFIYIVAIKHRGSIKIAYIRKVPFFYKTKDGFDGIEYQILHEFAKQINMKLEITRIADIPSNRDIQNDNTFQFDIICGGLESNLDIKGYVPVVYNSKGLALYVKSDSEDIYESISDFIVGDEI